MPTRSSQGDRVVVVDDLLATGGTAAATGRLLERLGADVIAYAFMIELAALHGREPAWRGGRQFCFVLVSCVTGSWAASPPRCSLRFRQPAGARPKPTPTPSPTVAPVADPAITKLARQQFLAWQVGTIDKNLYSPDCSPSDRRKDRPDVSRTSRRWAR